MPPRPNRTGRSTAASRMWLGAFIVVWAVCLVLRGITLSRGVEVPVWVEASADGGPPTVAGFLVETAVETSRLQVGDRLLAVGDLDLSAAGQAIYVIRATEAAWSDTGPVEYRVERGGTRLTVAEPRIPVNRGYLFTGLIAGLVWGVTAILLRIRVAPSREGQALYHACVGQAFFHLGIFQAGGAGMAFSLLVSGVAVVVAQPLLVRAFLSFPAEANSLRGAHRWWPWVFAAMGPPAFSIVFGFPLAPELGVRITSLLVPAYLATLAVTLTVNYRRSSPLGRRQVKWILLGVYVGAVLYLTGSVLTEGRPSGVAPPWTNVLSGLSAVSFPITVLIAMKRFDLFDIDRLLGATATVNILGFVGLGAGLLLVPWIGDALAGLVGVDATVSRTGVSLTLAAVTVGTGRYVRPQIDRLVFKERFAFQQAMVRLQETLAGAKASDELWETTGSALATSLATANCVIFASAAGFFVPVYSRGQTVPATVGADTDFLAWVDGLEGATHVTRRTMGDAGAMGEAVLASLDARVVVPIRRGGVLDAVVCLGEKGSGDIYTSSDLALLSSLANSLAIHLLRFDDAERLERSIRIQERMRRYVPGAVAQEIDQGHELVTGEREVSVLFVDIRGYTALSQGQDARDIFSTVNRFTETVSSIVSEGGGVVVEFNGDGMMAVFGAPRPLDRKERAAVEVARRLVREVPRLGGIGAAEESLAVGVGVATGPAFVGNIQSVDRMIWTAIGSTINLAARLQDLTRELEAGVLLDQETWEGADPGEEFVRHTRVSIRGRAGLETVFSLPYGAVPSATGASESLDPT